MQHPDFKFIIRIVGYIVGGAVMLLGLLGLASEFLERKTSEDVLFRYVLSASFLAFGIATCLALRFRYSGGLWFPVGLVLLLVGVTGLSMVLDDLLRKSQHPPLRAILIAAVLITLGISFLLVGHIRHRHKFRDLRNDTA